MALVPDFAPPLGGASRAKAFVSPWPRGARIVSHRLRVSWQGWQQRSNSSLSVSRMLFLSGPGKAYACDTTDENQVVQLFDSVASDFGEPDCVIFNAGAFVRKSILETESEEFERCWRIGCLGGFLVGREAAKRMLKDQGNEGPRGTILFTGATASLRGGALFHNLAVGKFGLRALAQSMARELGPQEIHVAHVVIDGQIRADREGYREDEWSPDSVLHPDAIAETYLQLYRQHRSAWSLEVDLRPWAEKF